jgi:hypothetical protein
MKRFALLVIVLLIGFTGLFSPQPSTAQQGGHWQLLWHSIAMVEVNGDSRALMQIQSSSGPVVELFGTHTELLMNDRYTVATTVDEIMVDGEILISGNFVCPNLQENLLLYASSTGGEVYVADLQSPNIPVFVFSRTTQSCPKISPNLSEVIYLDAHGLQRYNLATQVAVLVNDTPYDFPNLQLFEWSPSGNRVLLASGGQLWVDDQRIMAATGDFITVSWLGEDVVAFGYETSPGQVRLGYINLTLNGEIQYLGDFPSVYFSISGHSGGDIAVSYALPFSPGQTVPMKISIFQLDGTEIAIAEGPYFTRPFWVYHPN